MIVSTGGAAPVSAGKHALEVMLVAKRSATKGRVIEIESDFPPLDYGMLSEASRDERHVHDLRMPV